MLLTVADSTVPATVYSIVEEAITFVTVTFQGRDFRFSVRGEAGPYEVAFLVEFDTGRSAWFTLDPVRMQDPQLLQDHLYAQLEVVHEQALSAPPLPMTA